MTLQDLGNIGEFVGAIGVIVSLIYLSLQIRSNTRAVKVSSYQQTSAAARDYNLKLAADPTLDALFWKVLNGVPFADEPERRRATLVFSTALLALQSVHYQWEQGLLDEPLWRGHLGSLERFVRMPGFATYWENRTYAFSPSFVRFVETRLRDLALEKA